MRQDTKIVCGLLMATMAAGLVLALGYDLFRAPRIALLGVNIYGITSVVSVTISIGLTIVECRRPNRNLRWPLVLLAVSALPPLILMALFWNDPD